LLGLDLGLAVTGMVLLVAIADPISVGGLSIGEHRASSPRTIENTSVTRGNDPFPKFVLLLGSYSRLRLARKSKI